MGGAGRGGLDLSSLTPFQLPFLWRPQSSNLLLCGGGVVKGVGPNQFRVTEDRGCPWAVEMSRARSPL